MAIVAIVPNIRTFPGAKGDILGLAAPLVGQNGRKKINPGD